MIYNKFRKEREKRKADRTSGTAVTRSLPIDFRQSISISNTQPTTSAIMVGTDRHWNQPYAGSHKTDSSGLGYSCHYPLDHQCYSSSLQYLAYNHVSSMLLSRKKFQF
jgi:hypothetical protein